MAALGRFRCRAAIGDTHGKRTAQGSSLRGFLEFWLPESIYRHRSPLLDVKFYVVDGVLLEAAFVSALIGSFYVFADAFEAALLLWSAPAAPFEVTLPIRGLRGRHLPGRGFRLLLRPLPGPQGAVPLGIP